MHVYTVWSEVIICMSLMALKCLGRSVGGSFMDRVTSELGFERWPMAVDSVDGALT